MSDIGFSTFYPDFIDIKIAEHIASVDKLCDRLCLYKLGYIVVIDPEVCFGIRTGVDMNTSID